MSQINTQDLITERIQAGRLGMFNADRYAPQERNGFFGSIVPAFKVGLSGQIYRSVMMPRDFTPDPEWRGIAGLGSEQREELTNGITPEYQMAFADARSYADALQIRDRTLMVQQAEQKLAEAGYSGMGARLLTTALDPAEIALFSATGGMAMSLSGATKVGRLGAFLRSGFIIGATGATAEGLAGLDDPNRDVYDVMFAGLMSGTFGGTIGSFVNAKQYKALRLTRQQDLARLEAYRSDLARLEMSMLDDTLINPEISPTGKKYFDNAGFDNDADQLLKSYRDAGFSDEEIEVVRDAIANGQVSELLDNLKHVGDPEELIAKLDGAGDDFDAVARIDQEDILKPQPGNPDFPIDQPGISSDPVKFQNARVGFRALFGRSNSATERLFGSVAVDDAVPHGNTKVYAASIHSKWKPRAMVNNFFAEVMPKVMEYTGRKFLPRRKELVGLGERVREAIITGKSGDVRVKAIADAMSKKFADLLSYGQRAGILEGVPENANYFPRLYERGKMHRLIQQHGKSVVEDWFAKSYKSANPMVSDELAGKVGRGMLDIIMDADRLSSIERAGAMSGERLDILEEYLLTKGRLTQDEAVDVMRRLRSVGDGTGEPKPTTARAMNRTLLDENYVSGDGIRLGDMVNNNAFDVFHRYAYEVYGAATQKNLLDAINLKMGTEYKTIGALKEAVETEIRSALPPGTARDRAVRKSLNRIDLAWNYIGNKALYPNTELNEFARTLNKVVHTMYSGAFGAASMPETGIAIGSALPQFFKMMPVLPEIVRGAIGMKLNNQFIKEIATWFQDTMSGKTMRMAGMSDFADDFIEEPLTQIGQMARRGGEWSDLLSLLEPVTTVQRTMVESIATQKLYDIAKAGKKLSPKRQAALGITDDMWDRMANEFRKADTVEAWTGGPRISALNLSDWDKDVAAAYAFAIKNWSRRAVQDVDIGSLSPWMTHPVAKIVLQYRVFPIAAYENHLLHGLSMRDRHVFIELGLSSTFAATTFVAQTYRKALTMPEKDRKDFLEERLSMGNLMAVSFQRAGAFSFMPDAIDFLGARAGLDPIFTYRNTGLTRYRSVEDVLFSNPSWDVANNAVNHVGNLFRFATGQENFTQNDFSTARKLLPFNKVAGIDNMLTSIGQMFPEEKQRGQE